MRPFFVFFANQAAKSHIKGLEARKCEIPTSLGLPEKATLAAHSVPIDPYGRPDRSNPIGGGRRY
jgi:hypothetical protein